MGKQKEQQSKQVRIRMNKPLDAKQIIKTFDPDHKKESSATTRFLSKLEEADILLDHSYKYFKRRVDKERGMENVQILEMIKQNYIVSIISELEIFFKGIITDFYWNNEEGFEALLADAQINLSEAYQLFGHRKVTREYVIASHYSFQNINQIERVFSALSGRKFLLSIETIKSFVDSKTEKAGNLKETLMKQNIHWRKTLIEAFGLRHKIVHEGLSSEVSLAKVKAIGKMLMFFMFSVTAYCYANHFKMSLRPVTDEESTGLEEKLKAYKPVNGK